MRAGERLTRLLLCALLAWAPLHAHAVDNPEAPDLLAAFAQRHAPFEQKVSDAAGGNAQPALAEQARFLDQELNQAYQALLARLSGEPRRALVLSQRQWLRYRDAESDLIARAWTRESGGSSALLARGQFRAQLVRQRVEQLLGYAQGLP